MAVTDEGVVLPVSTGAVKYDDSPQTIVQVADGSSTGAVPAPPTDVTTRFGKSGQPATGADGYKPNVETPGPQTFENLAVKVVRAPGRRAAEGATQAQTPESPKPADDSSGR